MNRRTKDERGQVLSSLVAVLAVVAIVGGLLVLFGTRGNNSVADDKPAGQTSATPKPSATPSATPTGPSAEPTEPTEPTAPPETPSAPPEETPSVAPSTPAGPPASKPVIPPSERPAVEVYNNSSRKGLAEDVAIRARQAGWTVAGRDNWHGKIITSTVYYPPGMLAEANLLAKDIGVNSTKNALPNMKMDRLSVILTSDYAG